MDMTRQDGRNGSRNQSKEIPRDKSPRGARRGVERQNAAAIYGDFRAILIDIWRLEIDASD
jgi:hypothetical protein